MAAAAPGTYIPPAPSQVLKVSPRTTVPLPHGLTPNPFCFQSPGREGHFVQKCVWRWSQCPGGDGALWVGVFYLLLPVLCVGSWGIYGCLFTMHGAVLLWWHSIHYPKVHWRTAKVMRNGRKLFFFQWLKSQIVKSEMCLGGCGCACTAGYRLDWDTLPCPWQFCFSNLDSPNTNVLPQMSHSQLNLLSPSLMMSNSNLSDFPACALGLVCCHAQPCTCGAASDGGPDALALALLYPQPCQVPKTLKISFKASLGCASPSDRAHTHWMSWDTTGSSRGDALALMSFMSCYSGW